MKECLVSQRDAVLAGFGGTVQDVVFPVNQDTLATVSLRLWCGIPCGRSYMPRSELALESTGVSALATTAQNVAVQTVIRNRMQMDLGRIVQARQMGLVSMGLS